MISVDPKHTVMRCHIFCTVGIVDSYDTKVLE